MLTQTFRGVLILLKRYIWNLQRHFSAVYLKPWIMLLKKLQNIQPFHRWKHNTWFCNFEAWNEKSLSIKAIYLIISITLYDRNNNFCILSWIIWFNAKLTFRTKKTVIIIIIISRVRVRVRVPVIYGWESVSLRHSNILSDQSVQLLKWQYHTNSGPGMDGCRCQCQDI